MRPLKHILSSAAAGGAFYIYSSSIAASFICFLSGVLIDLDHFYDYYLNYKKWPLSLKDFYLSCIEHKFKRAYLLLHSLELVALLWFFIVIFRLNLFWVAVALGVSLHFLLDILGNRAYFFTYSFIYRMQKDFLAKLLFKHAP